MVEVASSIFGDADQAMPLVKQLVFEQCTKECRQAINPYKGKGLEVWMKICRELGGPLTNAGLAAAVMQASHKQSGGKQGSCFKCGQPGHLKRQCPQMQNQERPQPRTPGLCPRCHKGNHWANDCRSVKDISGQPLTAGCGGARPKNGAWGPRPQGRQIYGAMSETWPNLRPPMQWKQLARPGEQPQEAQDSTSVPPPDSY